MSRRHPPHRDASAQRADARGGFHTRHDAGLRPLCPVPALLPAQVPQSSKHEFIRYLFSLVKWGACRDGKSLSFRWLQDDFVILLLVQYGEKRTRKKNQKHHLSNGKRVNRCKRNDPTFQLA